MYRGGGRTEQVRVTLGKPESRYRDPGRYVPVQTKGDGGGVPAYSHTDRESRSRKKKPRRPVRLLYTEEGMSGICHGSFPDLEERGDGLRSSSGIFRCMKGKVCLTAGIL